MNAGPFAIADSEPTVIRKAELQPALMKTEDQAGDGSKEEDEEKSEEQEEGGK